MLGEAGPETNKGGIILRPAQPVNESRRHLHVFLEEGVRGRGLVKRQKGGIKIN